MPVVQSIRLIRGGGNLKACASVLVGKTVIHDFRVVHQPGQRAFVQAPLRSWLDGSGRLKYGGPLIELPEGVMRQVTAVVAQAYREEIAAMRRAEVEEN